MQVEKLKGGRARVHFDSVPYTIEVAKVNGQLRVVTREGTTEKDWDRAAIDAAKEYLQ